MKDETGQKIVRRMLHRGLLKRWRLKGSKSYLRLGAAAIARWQYSESLSRRLGPQALPYAFGSLSLFTHHSPSIVRLLPHELIQLFPGFPPVNGFQQWAYYRDGSGPQDRLFAVRVEYRIGGKSVVKKLASHIHLYRNHSALNQLIDEGRFGFHIVTATKEQEQAVSNAADQFGFPVELRTAHDLSLTMFL